MMDVLCPMWDDLCPMSHILCLYMKQHFAFLKPVKRPSLSCEKVNYIALSLRALAGAPVVSVYDVNHLRLVLDFVPGIP